MATILRPDLATRTSEGTSPPTPAMQDISAYRSRSRRIATWFANCAALEQPEHEYTIGILQSSAVMGPRETEESVKDLAMLLAEDLCEAARRHRNSSFAKGSCFYRAADVVALTFVKTPNRCRRQNLRRQSRWPAVGLPRRTR